MQLIEILTWDDGRINIKVIAESDNSAMIKREKGYLESLIPRTTVWCPGLPNAKLSYGWRESHHEEGLTYNLRQ
jgi:hypothetical protein